MTEKGKRRRKPLKPKAERDDAGIRFLNLAFRKAVEKTGPVVVFVMGEPR
jgi:hypothetical protein